MVAPLDGRLSVQALLSVLRAGDLRPTAFGRHTSSFCQGHGLDALRASERVRRPLARAYRRARVAATR
jgi:hypothetical protein